MNKRITLYQRLKPKAKEALRGNAVKYKLSTEEIVELLEKRELDSKYVKTVIFHTRHNNHTEARIFLSHMMRDKKLTKFYKAMKELNDVFGGYGGELSKLNQKMEKELYKAIKKQYSNAKEIIGAL